MARHHQSEPYAIAVRRIRRKALAFGTSALEIMLIITFLIVLLLLAYFSTVAASNDLRAEFGAERSDGSSNTDRPNSLPKRMADLSRQLESALAENTPPSMQELIEVAEVLQEAQDFHSSNDEVIAKLQERNSELYEEIQSSSDNGKDGHIWPPIIRLEEADGYSFATNSSEISAQFGRLLLAEVVPKILDIGAQFDVDTIEIVGHTDERAISGVSNLDEELIAFLRGRSETDVMAGDNAGLGFARAAAVTRLLTNSGYLSGYRVIPLSGAHIILRDGTISDGSFSGDRPGRRRIEIRMRRSHSTSIQD